MIVAALGVAKLLIWRYVLMSIFPLCQKGLTEPLTAAVYVMRLSPFVPLSEACTSTPDVGTDAVPSAGHG